MPRAPKASTVARPAEDRTAPRTVSRQVHSEELLQGRTTVEICHNGAIYRLQATKLGKLILTK